MDATQHNAIVSFIWGIADDVLRDVYVRGKYRDVILPMTVIRRLDCLLEPTQEAVIKMKAQLDAAGVSAEGQGAALAQAAGQKFYNTSPFTLRQLLNSPKQLRSNFEAYLDGFSANVKEIIEKFDFRRQLKKLEQADALGHMIEKFISTDINLSPRPVTLSDGSVKHEGLSNHGMGYVFEELLRKFNEDNNEEAGEHFTPRNIVHLMAELIFRPIADRIESSTYLVYDCACGTGGMLTEAEHTLERLAEEQNKKVSIHLYGQEVNAETYAICKADLLIKGEDESNIAFGSTLSGDAFPTMTFDFMLANPPYGKSWKTDAKRLGGKKNIVDPRFVIEFAGEGEYDMLPRSSDGQLLFLVNMLSKMKTSTALGSRVATVHNGSSLFTGSAGGGESNIRRWIIENDWLEAIIGLPENIFYNTGIATYIWVLTNRKPEHRKGKVQLIDAREWYTKLRRNLGNKNCELSPEDLDRIMQTFLGFEESEHSKFVSNDALGFWYVTVERPLRLRVDLSEDARAKFRGICVEKKEPELTKAVDAVAASMGAGPHYDFAAFLKAVQAKQKELGGRWSNGRQNMLASEPLSVADLEAKPVVKKKHKDGTIEYESDSNLRDNEQIPLDSPGGIQGYMEREVLPHVPDSWVDSSKTKIGYEIPFTRYFYTYNPPRALSEIQADIKKLESGIQELLSEVLA